MNAINNAINDDSKTGASTSRCLLPPLTHLSSASKAITFEVMTALMLGVAQVASAGQFEDGVAAAKRGDYVTAVKLWQPLANQGNAAAQYSLGLRYARGQGVAQDYTEALKWYRLAAIQGVAEAQHNLGVMYDKGQGVQQNDAEAVKWFRLAAKQGFAKAQHNLGEKYDKGEGVPQSTAEALKWYRLAANQGDEKAQNNLGVMYAKGQGVDDVPNIVEG